MGLELKNGLGVGSKVECHGGGTKESSETGDDAVSEPDGVSTE